MKYNNGANNNIQQNHYMYILRIGIQKYYVHFIFCKITTLIIQLFYYTISLLCIEKEKYML